jgi:hypothetical protein
LWKGDERMGEDWWRSGIVAETVEQGETRLASGEGFERHRQAQARRDENWELMGSMQGYYRSRLASLLEFRRRERQARKYGSKSVGKGRPHGESRSERSKPLKNGLHGSKNSGDMTVRRKHTKSGPHGSKNSGDMTEREGNGSEKPKPRKNGACGAKNTGNIKLRA